MKNGLETMKTEEEEDDDDDDRVAENGREREKEER